MFRSKLELFQKTRARWPDFLFIEATQGDLEHHIKTFPCLLNVYKSIEVSIEFDDNWSQIANWSFHQALNKFGRKNFNRSDRILRPNDVSFDAFEAMMNENLSDEEWREEKEIWANLPQIHI